MSTPLHNELKKEFQLERLILFSDAVFAIAITLLVIEIKIPELRHLKNSDGSPILVTDDALLHSLKELIPKFLGFIVSFVLIGLYWTIHHRMFGYVTSYDRKLLVLNLVFLFFIALMPFSTGFYSEYAAAMVPYNLKIPLTFYAFNLCGVGYVNFIMWNYISSAKRKLTEPPIDPKVLKYAKIRSFVVPTIFLLMILLAYLINVESAIYFSLLIPLTMRIIRRINSPGKKSSNSSGGNSEIRGGNQ